MAAAAAPYVAWLSAAASKAELVANQSRLSAGAFEAAFAATVPPPVIAANRALLMALIATNFLGQNTPAIAATEALYAEMWAQDVAAMVGYDAGTSVPAPQLATLPPTGLVGATAPTSLVVSTGSQLLSALPTAALSSLPTLSTAAAIEPTGLLAGPLATGANSLLSGAGSAMPATGSALASAGQSDMNALSLASVDDPAVSMSMGQANSVGAMSVPPSWPTMSTATPNPAVGGAPTIGAGDGAAGGAGNSTASVPRIPSLPRMSMAGLRGAGLKVGVATAAAAGIRKASSADAETPEDVAATDTETPEGTAPRTVLG